MTYIQDKLEKLIDEYHDFLKQRTTNIMIGNPNNLDKEEWFFNKTREALTDYHNHIVEKIQMLKRKHYNETEFMNHRNDYNDAHNEVLQSVLSILQDTNPKEL